MFRNHHRDAFKPGDRGQGFQLKFLFLDLFKGVRQHGGGPGGTPGTFKNFHFILNRLGTLGLQVEQVVVKAQVFQ